MATPGDDQVTDDQARELSDLSDRYGGQVHTADVKTVMGLTGCTDTGMEHWAIGFRYDTAEACEALTEANRRLFGHETLGPAAGPDGQLYALLIPYRGDGVTETELRHRFPGQTQLISDTAMVAALLGRDDVDPATVVACRHATREAFDAYAEANHRHYGHVTLGPATGADGGIYGLILLNLPDGVGEQARASTAHSSPERPG